MKGLLIIILFVLLGFFRVDAQDTINNKFILFLNGGVSIPENDYSAPPSDYYVTSGNGSKDVYGYALRGIHIDAMGVYIPSISVGLALRVGVDINSSLEYPQIKCGISSINQYMGGLYILTYPKQAKFNLYFLGLIGLVTANITNSDNSFYQDGGYSTGIAYLGGNENPGFGTGFGFYGGMGLSYKIGRRICFNVSAGYLISVINFLNGTVTQTIGYTTPPPPSYPPATGTSQVFMLMTLGILQTNFGLSYQI